MSKIGQKIVLFIEAGFQIEYLIALAWDSSFECNKPGSDWSNTSFKRRLEIHYKPSYDEFSVSYKAGYLFMNRSAIDEDAGSEVLKVLELEKSSLQMTGDRYPEYNSDEEFNSLQLKLIHEIREKGFGLFV